jgi:putative addiction module component (TIGR02574 family)
MSPDAEKVLQGARALPAVEQIEVIAALIAGLDEDSPASFDEAWLGEIHRRSAEYDGGGVTPVPWEAVKARLARESAKLDPAMEQALADHRLMDDFGPSEEKA